MGGITYQLQILLNNSTRLYKGSGQWDNGWKSRKNEKMFANRHRHNEQRRRVGGKVGTHREGLSCHDQELKERLGLLLLVGSDVRNDRSRILALDMDQRIVSTIHIAGTVTNYIDLVICIAPSRACISKPSMCIEGYDWAKYWMKSIILLTIAEKLW